MLRARHPAIAAVRHLGAIWGVELRRNGIPAHALADRTLYAALAGGLSFKVGGGHVICLCPPLTISDAELGRALAVLDLALASAETVVADA